MRRRVALVAAMVATSGLVTATHPAAACSPGAAAADSALPATGADGVSPMTSIILVTGARELPAGLELVAGGVSGTLPPIAPLGQGFTASGSASFWRLDSALAPGTDYVLRAAAPGGPRELTHFSTAASYDKTPGTPPQIDRLRLWRVRYPVSEIAAGGCVFSEYEGYFALDFTPGTVPGTPQEETVSILSLTPKTGGAPLQLVFSGLTALPGGLITSDPGNGPALGGGEWLSPAAALWKPELQPDREYCASISTFGRNDLAAPSPTSNVACAQVTSIDTTGGSSAGGKSGGCTVAGERTQRPGALVLVLVVAVALARRRR